MGDYAERAKEGLKLITLWVQIRSAQADRDAASFLLDRYFRQAEEILARLKARQ